MMFSRRSKTQGKMLKDLCMGHFLIRIAVDIVVADETKAGYWESKLA